MKAATWKTSPCLSLVVGLLVLAGICFDGRPVLAQTPVLIRAQEACPLPAGETAPEPPSVTAQDVENGRASLMDFALAARDRFEVSVQGEG